MFWYGPGDGGLRVVAASRSGGRLGTGGMEDVSSGLPAIVFSSTVQTPGSFCISLSSETVTWRSQ